MRPQRYYQFVLKDEQILSKIWRVSHIIIFMAIFVVSLIGAEAFCNIFDVFNYRCILFAKASTKFVNIIYKNQTDRNDTNSTNADNYSHNLKLNLGIFDTDYEIERRRHLDVFDISKAEKLSGVENMYVLNDELWIDNETLSGRAHLRMTSTQFESVILCDFVVLAPFVSVIASSFLTLIVILFSRTGMRSLDSVPPAYLYVYPLVIVSVMMSTFCWVAFNLVNFGINIFCSYFRHITGRVECSPLMDYFTKEQKRGHRKLYHDIYVSKIAYSVMATLWSIQLVIGTIRVLTTADYTFVSVTIKSKRRYEEEIDDYFEQWETEPAPRLANVVEELHQERKTN